MPGADGEVGPRYLLYLCAVAASQDGLSPEEYSYLLSLGDAMSRSIIILYLLECECDAFSVP